MKKLIMLCGLLVCCSPSIAKPLPMDKRDSLCRSMTFMGTAIMKLRQQGFSILETLEVSDGVVDKEKEPEIYTVYLSVVEEAYKRPMYKSKELQEKEANDFGKDLYFTCMKTTAEM